MSTQTIQVTLPSEIIYVSGTVNNKSYTWTLVDTAWQAIVDRAEDDTYAVDLSAVTAAGKSYDYTLVLYYGLLNLITDRTREDVLSLLSAIARIENGTGTVEDTALIKQTSNKGAYNFTDLNRVGAAVSYISGIIAGTGYGAAVSPKIDWMESDKPTEAQLNQYLADVEALRNGIVGILNSYAAESAYPLPEVPTDMLGLTYQEANDIETILLHIYKQIRYMSDHMYWVHSNDVYSGEV